MLTNSTFDGIADDRSATQIRDIDPQFVAKVVLDQVVVQITVSRVRFVISLATLVRSADLHKRHSRLDDSICAVDVHIYNLPHIAPHVDA